MMFTFIGLVVLIVSACAEDERKPMYKYRYETEDVMKTAASNMPVHGYHVAEGGYYPRDGISSGSGFGGFQGSSRGIGGLGSYRRLGGYQGSSRGGGLSGFQGSSGVSGIGGFQGSSGVDGIGGYQGSSGVNGLDGFQGSSGVSSLGGFQGSSGLSGLGGYQGSSRSGGLGGLQGSSRSGGLGGFQESGRIGGLGSYSHGLRGGGGFNGLQEDYGGRSFTGGSGFSGGLGSIGGEYIDGGNIDHYPISGQAGGGLGSFSGGVFPVHHHHGGISPIHHHGGEIVDKTVFSGGKKNLNDGSYEKSSGKKGEQVNEDESGFSKGKVGLQNSKGDAGYYNDEVGGKKLVEDGKNYNGQEHFNQEGENSDEKKEKSGHKKGHVVKGFKSSHHKDETGKTEEFYDEAHDEGDNFNFQGQAGKFGEGAQSAFKGGHDDSYFNADERKNQGNYNSERFIDKNNADAGQYGQRKYFGNGEIYGVNNGIDQQSLLGHQESSRIFKHHPHHVPFYHR